MRKSNDLARLRRHACLITLLAGGLLSCSREGSPVDVEVASRTGEPAGEVAGSTTSAGGRGLWVLAEGSVRVLDDPERIPRLIQRALELDVSDLFVQVYRGGRVFYPTDFEIEAASIAGADPEIDAFGSLIEAAHGNGIRVHAWVNVLSLSTRRDANLIEELGPEAVLVDRYGRSILDYPGLEVPEPDRRYYRMGTRGIYLDPAVPEVRERLLALFRDLVERYPDLDGLHLDYIRHPGVLPFTPGSRFGVGLDFGYGVVSRSRYRAETGQPDPIEDAPAGTVRGASRWDDWRRKQVTALVESIAATSRAARPDLVLSAAVISYVDRAYLTLAQDWRGWLESGAIDLAIPMVYTLDDRLFRYQLEGFAGSALADRIWPGVGVWLFDRNPARALRQLDLLSQSGFAGEVLFSDDAIAASPALRSALADAAPIRSSSDADTASGR